MERDDITERMELFMGSAKTDDQQDEPWFANLDVESNKIKLKLDSGADVCIISLAEYGNMNPKPRLEQTDLKVNGVSARISISGYFEAVIKRSNDNACKAKIYVANHRTSNLLSRAVSVKLNLIKRVESSSIYDGLGLMKCTPVKIVLKENANPYNLKTPRRIPYPLAPKVEEEIQKMLKQGVIVPVESETDWCAPLVPILKPNGKVRPCVDFRKLNKAIKRPRFILPTPDEIYQKMAGSKIFTTVDATSGYWQLPLDTESSHLTTFITESGRYRFTRLPFGISLASEIYQREMGKILQGLEGCEVYQDDIVIHGKSMEEHDDRLQQVLQRIEECGIKLNREKCTFRETSITFLGHVIDEHGIRAHPDKVKAVVDMEAPTNTTELKSFLGLVNYMSRYVDGLATMLSPLSALLRKDTSWVWNQSQQKAFDDVKQAIASSGTLSYYNPSLPTLVSSDASSYGIGGTIMQEQDGVYKPVAFVSRTMTDAEKRYAQIEKELLAIVYTCEKFSRYLVGMDTFRIITDHKPLIPIINEKDLDTVPARCVRLLVRLMRFTGVAEHAPGKSMVIADLLSRKPLEDTTSETDEDVRYHALSALCVKQASTSKILQIREETARDDILTRTMEYVMNGWPSINEVPPELREMYTVRNSLTVIERILMYADRMIIPSNMREEMLSKLHAGHLGITKTLLRAKESMWWPGITAQLKQLIENCEHCQIHRNMQTSEPLLQRSLPQTMATT